MPRQFDCPAPASPGSGEFNHAEGTAFPVVTLPAYPQDLWWNATNLQAWFQTRTTRSGGAYSGNNYDDLAYTVPYIALADSHRNLGNVPGESLNGARGAGNCKGDGYVLTFAKGESPMFTMRFHGCFGLTPAEIPAQPSVSGVLSPRADSSSVSFGGAFAGAGIMGARLSYSNNLVPNIELKHDSDVASGYSGLRPKTHNAGTPTGELVLQVHRTYWLGDGVSGSISLGGVTFTVNNPVCINPNDRQIQMGRVIRTYRFRLFAATGGANCVTIS